MAEVTEEYIRASEAASRFGLSDSQLRRLLISGKVHGIKIARNWLTAAPPLRV